MSTASLPSYVAPSLLRTPSYSSEPHEYEQRIALVDRLRPRASGTFVKMSRNGDARLTLTAQENGLRLPVYGSQGCVEGVVEVLKTDGVTSIEIKIEGRLRLREIAEGGTTSAKLCLDTALLWARDPNFPKCPPSLSFSLNLPTNFTYEDRTYPLPPTFGVKLSGVPGFTATIDYSVSAIIKSNAVPLMKSGLLGMAIGSTVVSTPFVYYPRTRPASPIPPPLLLSPTGFVETAGWRLWDSAIRSRMTRKQDIGVKLYIPASRAFCISQRIPFHLTLESSAISLAAFLPLGPTSAPVQTSKRATRIQLLRQSTVDVRNAVIAGTKTDMWRVDSIGEGLFRHAGDGPNWVSFSGEIIISDTVRVTGFKAAGLSVKDCILFSVTPPDPQRSPFNDMRLVIPVRLTTDVWTADGTGLGAGPRRRSSSESSEPWQPNEYPMSLSYMR